MSKPSGMTRWLENLAVHARIALGKTWLASEWKYPRVDDETPDRPWHPDGDWLFTAVATRELEDSDEIIAHMDSVGPLQISTGDTKPRSDGYIPGRPLNICKPTDPLYEVVDGSKYPLKDGALWVNDGRHTPRGPFGTKIRIPRDVRPGGWPQWDAPDSKVHLYDPNPPGGGAPTITEIQKFEPILINTGIRCHGIAHYRVNLPTLHPDVFGRSSADYPLAESSARKRDIVDRGARYRLTCATPSARQGFVLWPATGSDNQAGGDHPHAVPMGAVLRVKQEVYDALWPKAGPQSKAILEILLNQGIIIVDTSGKAHKTTGHHSVSFEPHIDWDQRDLKTIRDLKITDFRVYALDPPE